MIPAKKNKLFNLLFRIYHLRLLKNHFYRIRLTGEENLKQVNNNFPTIIYANHSNWWDGFTAYFLSSGLWKKDDYLMMDSEQMKKYSFFKYIGVFSVDRNDSNEVLKTINYAVTLLKNTNRYLWIFPQGGIQPQDVRPVRFFPGITKIAEKTGEVNLLPVAMRYEFLLEQRPEIFIKVGEPDIFNNMNMPKDYTKYLENKFENELNSLKDNVVNQHFDSFKTVFQGKQSRNTTIDNLTPFNSPSPHGKGVER